MLPLKHRTVIVPVDFSADSADAIQAGLERVHDPAGLHVVHILPTLDFQSHSVLREFAAGGDREADARRRLDRVIQEAGAEGVHAQLLTGDPGLATADYARQIAADLIVIPTHGHHGVRRFLLGSTTERVIRHAPCSVLVLRRRDAK